MSATDWEKMPGLTVIYPIFIMLPEPVAFMALSFTV